MSNDTENAYSHFQSLDTNEGATAAVVDMLTKACSAGDETQKPSLLTWAIDGDNLKMLRDKIKESAGEQILQLHKYITSALSTFSIAHWDLQKAERSAAF